MSEKSAADNLRHHYMPPTYHIFYVFEKDDRVRVKSLPHQSRGNLVHIPASTIPAFNYAKRLCIALLDSINIIEPTMLARPANKFNDGFGFTSAILLLATTVLKYCGESICRAFAVNPRQCCVCRGTF